MTFVYIVLFYLVFKIFFWCGPFWKALLNLLQYYLCFCGPESCRLLAPQPGIKSLPTALESEVFVFLEGEALTSGLPGKSPDSFYLYYSLIR